MGAAIIAVLVVAAALLLTGLDGHDHRPVGSPAAKTGSPQSAPAGASTRADSAAQAPARQSPPARTSHRQAAGGKPAAGSAPEHAHAQAQAASGGATGSRAHDTAFGPRDPEEANSFPVPASVQHAAAAAPGESGRLIPAAGAASNSEVEQELGEVEKAESESSQQALKTVPGGDSVAGSGAIPIPVNAPEAVQRIIAGGNAIADFPYRYGGGHGSFVDDAYDCSGSVSYALAAAGLLDRPLVSGELAHWGAPGPGRWVTIYANAGHTFMDVDGIWFDTAGRSGPYASRWLLGQPSLSGYAVRHPVGL